MTSDQQLQHRLSAHYAGKAVLITGGSGFIGRHLAASLAAAGARVEVTARHSKNFPVDETGAKDIVVSVLDVSNREAVRETVSRGGFDVVFHLAAKAAGDRGKEQMLEQAKVTLGGTINLAEALADSPTLMVHIGSSEEYGRSPTPFCETQALAPVSPYSAAKAAASQFLVMAEQSFGLHMIIARPSVVFGPGQKTGMVVPYLFDCYRKKQPAEISPGEQTRDFVYIGDCIEGLAMLGSRADLSGECFNLGSGTEVQLKQVAEEIARLTGYDGDLGLGSRPYRKAEVMQHRESVTKAQEKLGWQATTSLNDGLARTHQWWQSQD